MGKTERLYDTESSIFTFFVENLQNYVVLLKKIYISLLYTLTGDVYNVIRGYTDTIILALLMEKDSYGYEMNKSVQAITDKNFELKEATLYTSFRRLETSGYIASYWGDETTGARRRYYSITNKGRQLFDENVRDWLKAKSMIDTLLKTDT